MGSVLPKQVGLYILGLSEGYYWWVRDGFLQFAGSLGVRWGSTNTATHITASICWHQTGIIV